MVPTLLLCNGVLLYPLTLPARKSRGHALFYRIWTTVLAYERVYAVFFILAYFDTLMSHLAPVSSTGDY